MVPDSKRAALIRVRCPNHLERLTYQNVPVRSNIGSDLAIPEGVNRYFSQRRLEHFGGQIYASPFIDLMRDRSPYSLASRERDPRDTHKNRLMVRAFHSPELEGPRHRQSVGTDSRGSSNPWIAPAAGRLSQNCKRTTSVPCLGGGVAKVAADAAAGLEAAPPTAPEGIYPNPPVV